MNKLTMQTHNIVDENIKKIAELFPNCLTERLNEKGQPEAAIDFDMLRQELSIDIVEGPVERYQFTWPDKRNAIRLANAPTTDTLRPCREESVDFDNTQNLYIEGDNLQVLKLLRENYLGKVKMIYIDPPYNTGNDFVYNDAFDTNRNEWKPISGNYDVKGNWLNDRYDINSESNGRFHTDWLNMIYPRLKVAKDLLSEDGVIFISIDDNEQENLKKVCDEVFGSRNFIAELVWERAYAPKNDARFVSNSHDYILMFAKNIDVFVIGRLDRTEEANARYSNPDNDPRGVWKPSDISVKTYNAACDYPITTPSGRIVEPPAGRCWSLSKNSFLERLQDNRIWFGPNGDSVPSMKRFLSELKFDGMAPTSILFYKEVGHSQEGAKEVVSLFGDKGVFDGPKPVRLLERLLTLANLYDDSIILDFFSGSATTAHAVMKRNAEKDMNLKYILVQLPEKVSEKKKDQGFSTICEIGKERIRRAGKKIKEESPLTTQNLDTGFRVLKLDSSNMQDVYYRPEDSTEQTLFEDNIKPDRSSEDLLFQVMLECNLPLSAKIETEKIAGKEVFSVNEGYLIACFDEKVNEDVIKEVAKRQPYYFVMRDSSLATDNVADNFEQIWMAYSKDTIRRII
ncbi:MAG: site-specific DNA-methyltransferase [Bacteroidales bacterium]|nr:site-specific DNA-methyltransferase [Bacteroidales bacterium]